MNGKAFLQEMGLSSQKVVSMSIAPQNSSRALRELEMERDMSSLNADVQSAIYLHQRGVPVAQ
jgi:hypothetical protein